MKLLVIVNCQNDYISGSLGFPGAEEIINKILSIIDSYDDIIFLLDARNSNYQDTFEGKVLKTPHCIKNTHGYELHEKLKPYKEKALKIIEKETIPSIELAEFLKDKKEYDYVDVCGITSHMSVTANAIMIKSVLPNSLITVLKNCSISWDKALEAKAYNVLNANQIEVK